MIAGGCVQLPGGMHGCRGVCVVAEGACMALGSCVVARGCMVGGHAWWPGGACVGYDEIWSMSGRYAFYWNAFLF